VITWLGILFIAILLIFVVDDIAVARHNQKNTDNHKNIIKNPLPTLRPIRDPDSRFHATPTPVPSASPLPAPSPAPLPTPSPLPTQTPTPVPAADITPAPVPEPVLQPVPTIEQYVQPEINMTPVETPEATLTPGPDLAPSQNETAVLSSPPEVPIPTFSPRMTDVEPVRQDQGPGMIISALMGFVCIGFLAYLGFMMLRR
jgi:hypothetical protein